jgi:hypothetical protein
MGLVLSIVKKKGKDGGGEERKTEGKKEREGGREERKKERRKEGSHSLHVSNSNKKARADNSGFSSLFSPNPF